MQNKLKEKKIVLGSRVEKAYKNAMEAKKVSIPMWSSDLEEKMGCYLAYAAKKTQALWAKDYSGKMYKDMLKDLCTTAMIHGLSGRYIVDVYDKDGKVYVEFQKGKEMIDRVVITGKEDMVQVALSLAAFLANEKSSEDRTYRLLGRIVKRIYKEQESMPVAV